MIENLDTNALEAVAGGVTRCDGFSITLGDFAMCIGTIYTN